MAHITWKKAYVKKRETEESLYTVKAAKAWHHVRLGVSKGFDLTSRILSVRFFAFSLLIPNALPYAKGLLAVLSQPPETIPALPPSARRCCEYSNLIRP